MPLCNLPVCQVTPGIFGPRIDGGLVSADAGIPVADIEMTGGGVGFHPAFLTDGALAPVQQQTSRRVLTLFERREWVPAEAVETLQAWVPPAWASRWKATAPAIRPCPT
jgi:hypothetical protein